MAEDQEFVIVDQNGDEHIFPAGMDPKRAADVVRGKSYDPNAVSNMMAESRRDLARGVPRDDSTSEPKSSPLMESLSRAAHPTTTGDMLSLVAPQTGAEMWVPGVRMLKSAIRFASEEPKGTGLIQNATGYIRGVLRGAAGEALGKGVQQESPRLVKSGTDQPVVLPVARSRAPTPYSTAEGKGAFRENVESSLDKTIAGTPGAKEALPDLDKAIQEAKREADTSRDVSRRVEEIVSARGEPKKTTFRTSLSAPTPEGGRQSMSTTYRGAVRIGSEPPPSVPSAGPVAPYTHHSTDGLPRFSVMGSDVTAAEAQARGFTPSEIPAGAGAESSTATRDAALARQAARVQGQKAPARGAIPEFESTRPTPSAAPTQTSVPAGVKQTDVPLRSGQELSTPGSIAYREKEFAANNPIAQEVLGAARVGGPPPVKVDPKSVETLGGEMGPIAEAAYRRALGVPPGTKLDVGRVQALRDTAEPIMSRTDATRAGKALGLDANTVRGMRGGESGLIAPDLMEVLDKAMKHMSLDEMVTYLNRAPNANVYKYIESQIKNKIPF